MLWPCFVSDSVLNRLLAAPMSAPQQRGLCDHELLAERGRSVTLLASWIRDCLLTFTVTLVTHILNPSHILSFNMIRCLACSHSHHTLSHSHTSHTPYLSHSHNIPSHTCVHSLSALFTALGKLWVWYLHSLKPAYNKKVSVSLLFDCELGTDTRFYAKRCPYSRIW